MSVTLSEAVKFTEAVKPTSTPGRFRVRLISAGVGSSGVYPAEALQAAAEAKVFAAGTHMYLDHPSESERWERPERSVKDLAAHLVSDAVYVDEDGGALDADIEVFTPWRAAIAEMKDTIGLSIRALAEVDENDDQGRPVIAKIVAAESVDFVTKAGRGGRILALVESARAVGRAVARGVAEATANDTRERLSDLVRQAYGDGDSQWAWVRDFDDTTVWFQLEGDENGTYAQSYATGSDDMPTALTGDRIEVRVRTDYVPVGEANVHPKTTDTTPVPASEVAPAAEPKPAVEAGSTPPHKEEDPMGTIQVDEARVRDLEEKAGQIPALEAKVTAAEARADAAEERALQAEAGVYARDFARKLVTKANGDLAEASVTRIVASALAKPLPLKEGRLDTEAFTPVVEEARKDEETYLSQVAEASGIGSVRGVGPTEKQTVTASEADVDEAVGYAFGRKTTIQKGA